ncbi:MAG: hypothetical protein EZS28_043416 [Streblomastix strix]|uniref:Uncharacterized protein n=1 Tax=Streblomastix strix TaxID=222440 RepID=A0A5J4TS15_9EUKA|nr:MAG: hypothetical protein EZS28_043416 [Streblomastix strix]
MGQMIIEPNDDIRNQGLRLMKNKANWDSFVLTGCNADPQNRDGVWKVGSTSSQFRIQKQEDDAYDYKAPLPTPPIEYAIYQSIAYGITTHNIPLNAVMFAQKVIGYPICWNGAIPIDCFINPNGLRFIRCLQLINLRYIFGWDKWIKIMQSVVPLAGLFEAVFIHYESLNPPSLQSLPCQALMGLGYHQTLS